MRHWLGMVLLVPWIVAACGSEQEPAPNQGASEAVADAVPKAAPDAAPGSARSESMVLVSPAADGLPEVRYYSLGGA